MFLILAPAAAGANMWKMPASLLRRTLFCAPRFPQICTTTTTTTCFYCKKEKAQKPLALFAARAPPPSFDDDPVLTAKTHPSALARALAIACIDFIEGKKTLAEFAEANLEICRQLYDNGDLSYNGCIDHSATVKIALESADAAEVLGDSFTEEEIKIAKDVQLLRTEDGGLVIARLADRLSSAIQAVAEMARQQEYSYAEIEEFGELSENLQLGDDEMDRLDPTSESFHSPQFFCALKSAIYQRRTQLGLIMGPG
jgi:hypothetical protein